MPFKPINTKDQESCPVCKGGGGFKFSHKSANHYHGHWGEKVNRAEFKKNREAKQKNKTIVCVDCERRFYFREDA